MKHKLLFYISLFLAITCFGKKIYTMASSDFTNQFNKTKFLQRVYCTNEKKEKVWLYCNDNTNLTITLSNKKQEKLLLSTIRYYDGKIEAIKYNVWMPSRKVSSFNLNEITSIFIVKEFEEYEKPYFNISDSLIIAKRKNDSLTKVYMSTERNVIFLTKDIKSKIDTFRIMEDGCYNLTFQDGVETNFGVVQKITLDSIFISNYFNQRIASKFKKDFKNLGYQIKEIKKVNLLELNGRSFNQREFDRNNIFLQKENLKIYRNAHWYAVDYYSGEISLYRLLQTEKKLTGITENKGFIVWFEGE